MTARHGTIAVGIEYDGTDHAGAQQTAVFHTASLHALGAVCDHPVHLVAAGRTDAGVHARGQVAHFEMTSGRSARSLVLGANSMLPATIALRWARTVPTHFHARYSALARTYRYCILNCTTRTALAAGRVAFVFRALDVEAMGAAAVHLVGNHDFTSLSAEECRRARLRASWRCRCSGAAPIRRSK